MPFLPLLCLALPWESRAQPAAPASDTANPLLTRSPLPYELPPFAAIRPEHFEPAFRQGMAEELAEVSAIAAQSAAPTFENTVVALERSGELLARAQRAFGIFTSALTNPELERLDARMSPQFAAHRDAIRLNPDLFRRIATLHEKRASLGLDPESLRLLERTHRDFVRSGAQLPPEAQSRLRTLNAEIATRSTQFKQNVLQEGNASAVWVESRAELDGLTDAQITAAAEAAKAAGQEGRFLLRLANTTGQPLLATLRNRAVRERVMAASLSRGSRGGPRDNRNIVTELARLRAERAQLLGYPNHAAYQLEEQTAGTVDTVNQLLARLAPPAVANARREAADLQVLLTAETQGAVLTAADWAFYSERIRSTRHAFDGEQLRPYFELRRVLVDGAFFAATRLYGITFRERTDLQGYTPDMMVFEVFDADGSALGLFLGDFHARPNKRGGAWASAYVPQNGLRGTRPVIGNHQNIPRPPPGQPTLLTFDEVRTLFHEFGHALHGLFSQVKYPSMAGTSVPRDFVEYPSQVNEMWATWPEILRNYARHHQTGEPLPPELLSRLQDAEKFNQGHSTTELVAANVLDQAWHQLSPGQVPSPEGVAAFEEDALRRAGLDFAPVPPRYRSTYFSHIFSGGYSAGYYSYFWSEVLDADTVDWIQAHGGLTRANGDRFRDRVLSRGDSRDATQMFRDFPGHEPDIRPLLLRRGLDSAPGK